MYITMADTRFNNFRNLKSTFYPDQKQVKAYLKTGKVVRKNCNGPWKDYSTKKALQDRITISRTISEKEIKRTVSRTPWARNHDPKVPRYRTSELEPKWTKISNRPETKYEKWQEQRMKRRGRDLTQPFFKNRLSNSMPKFSHMPRLEPEEFKRRQKQKHDNFVAKKAHEAAQTDFGVSWESPNWFKTDTNGKKPDKSFKTLSYAGSRTLLKVKTPRNAGHPDLTMLKDRTARRKATHNANHNMKKTPITEYVNACVRTRVAIWKS